VTLIKHLLCGSSFASHFVITGQRTSIGHPRPRQYHTRRSYRVVSPPLPDQVLLITGQDLPRDSLPDGESPVSSFNPILRRNSPQTGTYPRTVSLFPCIAPPTTRRHLAVWFPCFFLEEVLKDRLCLTHFADVCSMPLYPCAR